MKNTTTDDEVNSGIPLDISLLEKFRINKSAVERRCGQIEKRRCVKKKNQLAWLFKTVTFLDLTALAGDDTPGSIHRLCFKAKNPISEKLILEKTDMARKKITVGAVCVYPNLVAECKKYLEGTGIPIASVATGFPAGQTPLETRCAEIRKAVMDGADEIDIVISRKLAMQNKWKDLYDEIKQMRKACGHAHMKVILGTGELATLTRVYQCSMVAMMAGADFIKTSTGKEPVNAILPVGLVMMRAIRDYYWLTGYKIGFKPAGGIRTCKQALSWLFLMKEELGNEWLVPSLFRIGASGLMIDLERQLYHGCTNLYGGDHYMAMC